jgi:uncharacterized RDD family membrane protein YckC
VTSEPLPPRGWYDDPADAARERYWDGAAWTQRVRRKAEPVRVRRRGAAPLAGTLLPGPAAPAEVRPRPAAAPVTAAGAPEGAVPLATFGQRAVAMIVDSVIQMLILAGVFLVLPNWGNHLVGTVEAWYAEALQQMAADGSLPVVTGELTSVMQQLTLAQGGLMLVYSLAFLLTWGATPGMRLLRLAVIAAPPVEAFPPPRWVTAAQGAQKLDWGRAIWRSLGWAILNCGASLLVFLQIFSLLMPLWHPRRQTLHDIIARTLVVRR